MRVATIIASLCMLCPLALGQINLEGDWRPSIFLQEAGSIRPPAQLGEQTNPAAEYFHIWDRLGRDDRTVLSEAASNIPGAGKPLPKRSRELCNEHRDYIDSLIRNANSGNCEWGVDMTMGWNATLPHLSFLRGSLRVIRLDAYRCLEDGADAQAAERIAAMLRMSEQTRNDHLLISSLVGAAICSAGLNMADEMLEGHRVNPAAARTILAGLKSIPKDNPFGSADAILGERQITCDWMRTHYKGDHAGVQLMKEVQGLNAFTSDPLNVFVYNLSEQQVASDLDRYEKYFEDVSAAWRKPDNTLRLSELHTRVWEGQYGMISRVVAPSFERTASVMTKTRRDIDRVQAQLETIIRANEAGQPIAAGKPST